MWARRPGSQSPFQFIPKVFDAVEVTALCGPIKLFHNKPIQPCLYGLSWNRKGPFPNSSYKVGSIALSKMCWYAAEHVSGAERAKSSRSAERVFIQRPERSLCLAPVPLRYRSHHESRACTNPPRIHLCLQQLTKLSAYTSKIIREIFPKANRRCI